MGCRFSGVAHYVDGLDTCGFWHYMRNDTSGWVRTGSWAYWHLTVATDATPCLSGKFKQRVGEYPSLIEEYGDLDATPWTQSVTRGEWNCTACRAGWYMSDEFGVCTRCPGGALQSTPSHGATSVDECLCTAGYYADPSVPSGCTLCPHGTFKAAPTPGGLESCLACPADRVRSNEERTGCDRADAASLSCLEHLAVDANGDCEEPVCQVWDSKLWRGTEVATE